MSLFSVRRLRAPGGQMSSGQTGAILDDLPTYQRQVPGRSRQGDLTKRFRELGEKRQVLATGLLERGRRRTRQDQISSGHRAR